MIVKLSQEATHCRLNFDDPAPGAAITLEVDKSARRCLHTARHGWEYELPLAFELEDGLRFLDEDFSVSAFEVGPLYKDLKAGLVG